MILLVKLFLDALLQQANVLIGQVVELVKETDFAVVEELFSKPLTVEDVKWEVELFVALAGSVEEFLVEINGDIKGFDHGRCL